MALRQQDLPQPPVRLVTGRHVTVIDDGVVEEVSASCGMTGAGLYMLLERRVNKEGEWVSTIGELAAAFGCSVRHIRDTCKTLEDAGFIVREAVLGPRGMNVAIRFILPKHMRTYRAEPTPDVTPEPTPEPSRATVLESSNQVVTSKGDTPSSPPKPRRTRQPSTESDDFLTFYQAFPRHQGRADAWRAWQTINPDAELIDTMMASLYRLLPEYQRRPPDKVPLPATWLNGGRWTDEPTKAVSNVRTTPNGNRLYNSSDLADMVRNGGSNGSNRDDEAFIDSVGRLVQ